MTTGCTGYPLLGKPVIACSCSRTAQALEDFHTVLGIGNGDTVESTSQFAGIYSVIVASDTDGIFSCGGSRWNLCS